MMTDHELKVLIRDLKRMRDDGETAFDVIVDRAIERLGEHYQTPKQVPKPKQRALKRKLLSSARRRFAQAVTDAAAESFGVEPSALKGKGKTRTVVRARQTAMAALREAWPDAEWAQISSWFNRDHSTAVASVQLVVDDIRLAEIAADVLRTAREQTEPEPRTEKAGAN